jgi:hypothetical protein
VQNQATEEVSLEYLHILDVVNNYTSFELQILLFFCQFIYRLAKTSSSTSTIAATAAITANNSPCCCFFRSIIAYVAATAAVGCR